MTVKAKRDESTGDLQLEIDNGDLKAWETITQKYKFKDEQSLLRFALAVLIKAEGRSVKITDAKGSEMNLYPSDELLTKES